MIIEIFPKLKNFSGFCFTRQVYKNSFSYELHDTFSFSELENRYYYFNKLSKLDITIVISSSTRTELKFFLKSLKFPLKN